MTIPFHADYYIGRGNPLPQYHNQILTFLENIWYHQVLIQTKCNGGLQETTLSEGQSGQTQDIQTLHHTLKIV